MTAGGSWTSKISRQAAGIGKRPSAAGPYIGQFFKPTGCNPWAFSFCHLPGGSRWPVRRARSPVSSPPVPRLLYWNPACATSEITGPWRRDPTRAPRRGIAAWTSPTLRPSRIMRHLTGWWRSITVPSAGWYFVCSAGGTAAKTSFRRYFSLPGRRGGGFRGQPTRDSGCGGLRSTNAAAACGGKRCGPVGSAGCAGAGGRAAGRIGRFVSTGRATAGSARRSGRSSRGIGK